MLLLNIFLKDDDGTEKEKKSPNHEEEIIVHNYLSENEDCKHLKESIKKLNSIVDQILPTIRCFIMKNNDETNPCNIIKLKQITNDESLWISIIFRLINKIDLDDSLGASVISIFLEETPLPSKVLINNYNKFFYEIKQKI